MFQDSPPDGGTEDTTRVAHFLLDKIVDTITKFAQTNSEAFTNVIALPATGLLTIFVLLWGVGIASGQIQEPIGDGVRRIIRMVLITGLGLTAGLYQGVIIDFFVHVPEELAAHLNTSGPVTGDGAETIAAVLDDALSRGIIIGNNTMDKGESLGILGDGLSYELMAVLIYVDVAALVAIAAGIVFVAFISLALLLALGPFFILMALFPATQRFFDAWLSQLITVAILYLLVSSAVSLCFDMFVKFTTAMPLDSWEDTILNMVKLMTTSIAIVSVLTQTNSMASALGQGVALSSQQFTGRFSGATNHLSGHGHSSLRSIASAAFSGRKGSSLSGLASGPLSSPAAMALRFARKKFGG
jgi:type IV secretion system protein VirB6